MTAGKGSRTRPRAISQDEWDARHAETFPPRSDRPRPRFKVGQRVRMSEAALRQGVNGPKDRRTGIVVEVYGRDVDMVRVRRDGMKSTEKWAASFWEAI